MTETPPAPQLSSYQGDAGMATVTPISAWKKKAAGTPLTLPSGNVAIVRNPGMETFVTAGIIPNSLMPIVRDAIEKHKAPSGEAMQGMVTNTDLLRDVAEFMDRVVMMVVTQPQIAEVPPRGVPRSDEVLYIDEVEAEDKSFIFQFAVGGTRNLEQFRNQRTEVVADLAPSAEVPVPPE